VVTSILVIEKTTRFGKRRFPISVSPPERDWQRLLRRISQGLSLPKAAEITGIPIEEAIDYVSKRLENRDLVSFELKIVAERALKTALKTLEKLAKGDQRTASESISGGSSTSYTTCDLEAAKALAKLSIDALKLGYGPPKANIKINNVNSNQADLWDFGPWNLKTPS
jgi:hypothetical protein